MLLAGRKRKVVARFGSQQGGLYTLSSKHILQDPLPPSHGPYIKILGSSFPLSMDGRMRVVAFFFVRVQLCGGEIPYNQTLPQLALSHEKEIKAV